MKKKGMHSTVAEKGRYVTQTFTMVDGYKKVIRGIDTSSFMVGEFTHFDTKDGRKVMVRTDKVLFIETTSDE